MNPVAVPSECETSDEELAAAYRERMGLDRPLTERRARALRPGSNAPVVRRVVKRTQNR